MTDNKSKHIEEIINHLKRVENDYGIDLTEEMRWLRGLNGYKEYLCTKSVGTFEKGETYKVHPNSPIAKMKNNFVTVEEEPVSEDLDTAAKVYADNITNKIVYKLQLRHAVVYGANWQLGQFEKNRLAACDRQTEEEAEIEYGFVMSIVEKEHRQPTFDDAIKYGMKIKEEQMMRDAKSGIGNNDNYIQFEDGTWIDLDPSMQLKSVFNVKDGEKVKVLVIKED